MSFCVTNPALNFPGTPSGLIFKTAVGRVRGKGGGRLVLQHFPIFLRIISLRKQWERFFNIEILIIF